MIYVIYDKYRMWSEPEHELKMSNLLDGVTLGILSHVVWDIKTSVHSINLTLQVHPLSLQAADTFKEIVEWRVLDTPEKT